MSIRHAENQRPRRLPEFRTDLARFTSAGYGTLHDPAASQLRVGQRVAVTDADADTVEAEVLAVRDGAADVRIHWDQIVECASTATPQECRSGQQPELAGGVPRR